jgi:hypothetical protein
MKRMFTDNHIQVESGNQIFDGPRQVVRRRFPGQGVIWFEKSVVDGKDLQKLSKETSELLEDLYAGQRNSSPLKVIK